ncbi:MAG: DNA-3-methyladenine glycosylase [Candidatus Woesearchaeota archaeon]
MRIKKEFYRKGTIEIAKDLLGKYLVTIIDGKKTVGKIMETEAYLHDDPASHSFKGKTKRNEPMFMEAGKCYVYFIYGMYECFNVVTNKENIGEAVLIRVLKPVEGIDFMIERRGKEKDLCNGPGKLTISMGISRGLNGVDLSESDEIFIEDRGKFKGNIIESKRIGISKGANLDLRFSITD